MTMKLKNAKHERFCQEYIIDLNGAKAYRRTYGDIKAARIQACKLLTKANIGERIAELQIARAKRTEISQDRVLKELACLGHSNIKDYVKHAADGFIQFKDIDNISEEDAKAIEAIKVNYKEGRIEFKLHSKTKTLEMIGRHLGMFKDIGDQLAEIIYQASEKYMPKKINEKK